jgi:CxxC motif-containing protein (DUF1111 family)
MTQSTFLRHRRRVGIGLGCATALGAVWWLTPGLPVLRAPRASVEVKAVGLTLFRHEWAPRDPLAHGDGLGPVFNAKSCAECHFQGGVGGGGDNGHNVLAFQALPTPSRADVVSGLVHHHAVEPRFQEHQRYLSELFPVVKNGLTVNTGCNVLKQDFNPVKTLKVNSTALFGAGWVDRISPKTIQHRSMVASASSVSRELGGDFAAASVGRVRVLPDGRVGKFGWKAQFATLEEFVAAACANEIGLGNPKLEQAKPLVRGGAPEPKQRDLDDGQFRSLVAFVDTLPRPTEVVPADADERRQAERGRVVFREVGCASCHVPDVGGVEGVYSDFSLHRLDDRLNKGSGYSETPPVPLPEEEPLPDEWKTPPLWGVADSAPYFHDGGSPTLEAAILRHRGDADSVTRAYERLYPDDRRAVVSFLRTLKAPADAVPTETRPAGRLAMAR